MTPFLARHMWPTTKNQDDPFFGPRRRRKIKMAPFSAHSFSHPGRSSAGDLSGSTPSPARRPLACASGCELVERGFVRDVELAAELDVGALVPVLVDGYLVSAWLVAEAKRSRFPLALSQFCDIRLRTRAVSPSLGRIRNPRFGGPQCLAPPLAVTGLARVVFGTWSNASRAARCSRPTCASSTG